MAARAVTGRLWICALAILLAATAIAVSGQDDVDKKKDNQKRVKCNDAEIQNITLSNSTDYAYINCQDEWTTVNVLITGPTNAQLALEFASLKFDPSCKLKVFANISGKEVLIDDETNIAARKEVWMPTGQSTIRIELKRDAKSHGVISLNVRQACDGVFGLAEFTSPIIPNKGKEAGLGSTHCTFKVITYSLFDFHNFTLTNGSSLKFTGGVTQGFNGPFTTKPEYVIIGDPTTVLDFTLDLTNPSQIVTFSMSKLAGEACGGNQMVLLKDKVDLTTKGGVIKDAYCVWLVQASDDKKVKLEIPNFKFGHINDLLSVADSGDLSGKPLLQVTTLAQKPEAVVSSGKYLVITLNSLNFDDKTENLQMTVSPVTSGGRLSGSGNLTLGARSDFFLTANNNNESIHVDLGTLTKLEAGQTITVYTDFTSTTPLITFNKDNAPISVSSPKSQLRVQSSGLSKAVNVSFQSIPQGSGCMRTFIGVQEANMRLISQCTTQSTWLIRPDVAAPKDTAIYLMVWPNNVKSASIKQLNDGGGLIELKDATDPFMLAYIVDEGVRVDLAVQGQNFEMSYVTAKRGAPIAVSQSAGSDFSLFSPFFPGPYPSGSSFHFNVTLGDKPADNYFATFEAMSLSSGDSLRFANGTVQFVGNDLPGDMLMSKALFADVTFEASKAPGTNPKGANGFRIDFAPVAQSETIKEPVANKTYSLDPKLCKDSRCVYIIDIPKPDNKLSSLAINLTLTVAAGKTLKDGDLLVWDGESSLRSPLLAPAANLSRGGTFQSTNSKLIIRYQGAENVTFSFTTFECCFKDGSDGKNGTYTMCERDRICMRPEWRCNRVADCSDGTDEFYCDKYPNPYPSPSPKPGSNGWKTAFWLCLPLFVLLGVLLTKGVPVAMQRFRESRYHQFHDLGDH